MTDGAPLGTVPLDQTMLGALGIEIREATAERVVATMPVGPASVQPFGYLHGGASVALAETAMSIGATLAAGDGALVFGAEINASHVRPKRSGTLTAVGVPAHLGRTSQVWEVRITDENGKTVCVSRCTVVVVDAESS